MTRDPLSPPWEDCKVCGGDHWTKDHPPTHDTPEAEAYQQGFDAAWAESSVGVEGEISEAVATERARIAGYDANYHGAMQGWTEAKAEIARLRAALTKQGEFIHAYHSLHPGTWMACDVPICQMTRAALAPSEPPGSGRG